jgi:hypothetical protein
MRTIAVGDVHGCLDELRDLLRACGHDRHGDRVVLVGDLVAKGPDSQGVIQLARENGVLAVQGNHDAHALAAWRSHDAQREVSGTPAGAPAITPDRRRMLHTFTPDDWRYLEGLPLFLRLGAPAPGGDGARPSSGARAAEGEASGRGEVVVIHGGAVPGVAIERQEREHLLALRSITPDGRPSKRVEPAPWASLWRGPEHIVFGHDAVRGLQQYDWAIGLDTGCVYGRRLTAWIVPDGRLVSVPARRAYTT